MEKCMLLFMLFLCHTSSVKHSVSYLITGSSGVSNFPEFVAVMLVDEVQVGYCSSDIKRAKPTVDWAEKCIADVPDRMKFYSLKCLEAHQFFKITIDQLRQRLNQSEGVHVFQRVNGCEWDNETGENQGFNQYGYDGEDFLALDLNTLTWTAPKPQAFFTKQSWDADKMRLQYNKYHLTQECPSWLKEYVDCGKSVLQRTDFPSVSLLQKTPSSPVRCHATGFYPGRATMLWRKDGGESHENVDHGEILPNHDGTYQMSVDLDVSSIQSEDWGRYDCVFQFSGIEGVVITKLDPAVIKTNQGDSGMNIYMCLVLVIIPVLLVVGAAAVYISRRKNGCVSGFTPAERSEDNEES